MARKIQDLKMQVQALLQKSIAPAPAPTNIDMNALATARAEIAFKMMMDMRKLESTTPPTDTGATTSDANADGDDRNMSCDSIDI